MNKKPSRPQEENPTSDPVSTNNKRRSRQSQQESVDEHYQQMKQSTGELLEEGKKILLEAQDTFKEYSDELAKNVKKNPLTSVLIAGGIGFILSSLFRK
ncbi:MULTISPECIES: hypothetical protein [unclassified Legionella]|uniref:hypothetical protein n=1 Tax=unclassified Legionella TaxID=2622702 RepID=UPI0010568D1E|nr:MULTISPECIES: hypothetical protein [unclassified Legionella]MDI9818179.1 hypothetical protein [Legionella sp. PL877]